MRSTIIKALCAVVLLLGFSTRAQILTYQLLPGATITPWDTGVTEALSGTIQWYSTPLPGFPQQNFEPLVFDLTSATCHLTLYDGTHLNSAAALDSNVFAFAMTVNATGLSLSSGNIQELFNNGTYTGPPDAPTQLNLPDLRIAPLGGGVFFASLSFTAVLVPEPSAPVLIAVALLLMLVWRLKTRKSQASESFQP
jgi:hypothetical protein